MHPGYGQKPRAGGRIGILRCINLRQACRRKSFLDFIQAKKGRRSVVKRRAAAGAGECSEQLEAEGGAEGARIAIHGHVLRSSGVGLLQYRFVGDVVDVQAE